LFCNWFWPPKKKLNNTTTENYCNPDKVNVQDSCPTGVYDDLRKIKNQLGDISDEVADALKAQKHYRKPTWDIRVRSKQKPYIGGPIGGTTTKEDFETEYENIITQDGKHKRICMIDQHIKPFVPKVEGSCQGPNQPVGDGGCNNQCSSKFPGFNFYRSDLKGCVKDYCYKPTNKAMKDTWFTGQCNVQPPAQTPAIDIQWTVGDGNPGDKYEYAVTCKNNNGVESDKMIFGTGTGDNLRPYVYVVDERGYQPSFCWKSLPNCDKNHSRVLYQKLNDGEWTKVREVPQNISLSTGVSGGPVGICTWLGPGSALPPADGWIKYPGKDMGGNDIGCSWMPMSDYNNLDKLKKNCLDRNCVGFIKVKQKGNNNNTFLYCPKNKAGKNYLTNYNFNYWDSGDAYVYYK